MIFQIIIQLALICLTLKAFECQTTRSPVSDEALDKALTDKRYLMRQLKCALGEVPCDPVGKRLKSMYTYSGSVPFSSVFIQLHCCTLMVYLTYVHVVVGS